MRITGGAFRSRSLASPSGSETRPTADRVREALFSILENRYELTGARVLDLYAGTGALGLEALSRGASHVTFVERRREALAAIRTNVASLGVLAQSELMPRTVHAALAALAGPFELIFADPPYADVQSGVAAEVMSGLARLLGEGSVFVLEHGKKAAAPSIAGLGCVDSRTYGDTALVFYEPR